MLKKDLRILLMNMINKINFNLIKGCLLVRLMLLQNFRKIGVRNTKPAIYPFFKFFSKLELNLKKKT